MLPRRKLPPLNALRAFETAGRRLNFRIAADELGVTQGAVAQQVRALEEHLGQALFRRLSRGLELTPQGSTFLAEVSRAFDALGEATERMAKPSDKVTISVTPTVATRLLIPRIAALQEALPGVELRTIADENMPDFDRGEVDLAIGLLRPPFPPDVEAVLLVPQDIIAVASPALIGDRPMPLDDAAIIALPLVHCCFDHWSRFLNRPAGLPGPRYSLTTLAIDAALAGQGAVVASYGFVAGDIRSGRLVRLSERSLRVGPDYYLVRKRAVATGPAAKAVWDWCIANLVAGAMHPAA